MPSNNSTNRRNERRVDALHRQAQFDSLTAQEKADKVLARVGDPENMEVLYWLDQVEA